MFSKRFKLCLEDASNFPDLLLLEVGLVDEICDVDLFAELVFGGLYVTTPGKIMIYNKDLLFHQSGRTMVLQYTALILFPHVGQFMVPNVPNRQR